MRLRITNKYFVIKILVVLVLGFSVPLALAQSTYAQVPPPDPGGGNAAPAAAPTCTLKDKTKCQTCPDGKTSVNQLSDCPVTCNQKGVVVDCSTAQDAAVTGGNCASVNNCDLVSQYLNPAIKILAAFVGLAVTIAIAWGGVEYASSGGDAQKVSIAKNRIRNAIIALLAFFFLFALLNFLIPGGIL